MKIAVTGAAGLIGQNLIARLKRKSGYDIVAFDKHSVSTKQLAALIIPETFEVIDWPAIFRVRSTPLQEAMMQTFRDPSYSSITLEF